MKKIILMSLFLMFVSGCAFGHSTYVDCDPYDDDYYVVYKKYPKRVVYYTSYDHPRYVKVRHKHYHHNRVVYKHHSHNTRVIHKHHYNKTKKVYRKGSYKKHLKKTNSYKNYKHKKKKYAKYH
jgi:hypothetical protein